MSGKVLYYSYSNFVSTETDAAIKWQQGTYVFEADGTITVYLNGKKTQTIKDTTKDTSGTYFGMGANVSPENYHTKMECYGFRIYNRALSDKEVEQNYKIDQLLYSN